MKQFVFYQPSSLALVCLPSGSPVVFSLEAAAQLTGVHTELLRYYHRCGLIELLEGTRGPELFLGLDGLQEVRRIEHYRRHLGVGLRALPLLCELRRAGERHRVEFPFLN